MSKMSQLHAELSEQAYRLGYASLENAMADGYVADYENATLVDGREQAHKDWLEIRETTLKKLEELYGNYVEGDYKTNTEKATIKETIDFIKEGEI